MRHLRPMLAAALVAGALAAGASPNASAVPFVRTFLVADQIGTPGDDVTTDASHGVTAGTVAGALPGQTGHGGLDAFVRDFGTDLTGGLTPYTTYQLGGPGDDRATAVAAYYQGFFVGGVSDDEHVGPHLGGEDGWVAAYDAFSGLDWSLQIGGAGDDAVRDVAVGGGYYVAGHEDGAGFVRRYDGEGDLVWDADVSTDDATRLLYTSRRLFVVEQQWNEATTGAPSYRLAALDPFTGDLFWRTPPRAGVASAIAMDPRNVYVTGVVGSPGDGFVTARDVEGGLRWSTHVFDGLRLDSAADAVTAAVTDYRNLVVTVDDSRHDSDTIMGISGKGDRLWTRRLADGLTTTSMSFPGGPLLVGGSTDSSLGSDNLGGQDAVAALFTTYQPDISGAYYNPELHSAGDFEYGPGQRLVVPVGRRGEELELIVANEGEVAQELRLRGCGNHAGYRFEYDHFADITGAVTSGGYLTDPLGNGEPIYAALTITRTRGAAKRTTCALVASSTVTGDRDRLLLVVKRR